MPLVALCACQYAPTPLCRDDECLKPSPDAGSGTCHKDPDCPLGSICDGTRCASGCRSSRDCPSPKTCNPNHVPYGICVSPPPPPIDAGVPDVSPPDAVPVDAPSCVNQSIPLLTNGNFDLGAGHGWTEHPAAGEPLILAPPQGITARSGGFVGWLGGYVSSNESITQSITIPPDATLITVSGYYQIHSSDALGSDVTTVTVSGLANPTFTTLTNLDTTTAWTHFGSSQSLGSGAAGVHTFTVNISNDSANATNLFLDDLDVSVQVCR